MTTLEAFFFCMRIEDANWYGSKIGDGLVFVSLQVDKAFMASYGLELQSIAKPVLMGRGLAVDNLICSC